MLHTKFRGNRFTGSGEEDFLPYMGMAAKFRSPYTLQEMCCGFLLSREMWYRKSVLPGTGAGWAELKIG